MPLQLRSDDFENNDLIPQKFSCDGQDFSPHLAWDSVPEGTLSFVLICDDPDAPMGTWDHWLLYNIPPDIRHLEEHIHTLPEGTQEGSNSWNRTGYGGPCPPDGEHRYFFKLYALDKTLLLDDAAKKFDIIQTMQDHILGQAELIGRYSR